MLPAYDGDHSDWCEKCDEGGNLLCCDFCHAVYHPECLDPPTKNASSAKYWACDECAEDMWCAYSGQPRATRPVVPLRAQGDGAASLASFARFGADPAAALAALAAGLAAPALSPAAKRPKSAFFGQPKPPPKPSSTSAAGTGRLGHAKRHYMGVAFEPATGQWHAVVAGAQGQSAQPRRRELATRLGPFPDAEAAARAHDVAARKVTSIVTRDIARLCCSPFERGFSSQQGAVFCVYVSGKKGVWGRSHDQLHRC